MLLEDDGVGPATLTEMRLSGLDRAPEDAVAHVRLASVGAGSSSLTIALRASEASTLMRAPTATDAGCSDACDVVLAPARRLEAAIQHAVLDDGPDGLCAELTLAEGDDTPFRLACHVADALTLALRAHAPIYATRRVLDHAGDVARADSTSTNKGKPECR